MYAWIAQSSIDMCTLCQIENHNVTVCYEFQSTNLMSDIGGQLGLWIGMSVLTLVEYFELICRLICGLCSCKKSVSPQDNKKSVP